jgi:energy-coupling factor transport system permease protein
MNIFYSKGRILWEFGIFKITEGALIGSATMLMNNVILTLINLVFLISTLPSDVAYVVKFFLYFLKIFKININEIALVITLVMRFTPVVFEETERIMIAQKSRGAKLNSGGIFKRIRLLFPILNLILILCFKRAAELALAMECRCYGYTENRTHMKKLKLKNTDFLALFVVFLLFSGIILCRMRKVF